jgi:hypothetical protein
VEIEGSQFPAPSASLSAGSVANSTTRMGHPLGIESRRQSPAEGGREASQTREIYLRRKKRDASRGSPRSFSRAKDALLQDDKTFLVTVVVAAAA